MISGFEKGKYRREGGNIYFTDSAIDCPTLEVQQQFNDVLTNGMFRREQWRGPIGTSYPEYLLALVSKEGLYYGSEIHNLRELVQLQEKYKGAFRALGIDLDSLDTREKIEDAKNFVAFLKALSASQQIQPQELQEGLVIKSDKYKNLEDYTNDMTIMIKKYL